MPPLLATTKNDNKSKHAIYKLYDISKGGTDVIDQRMGYCKLVTPQHKHKNPFEIFFCKLTSNSPEIGFSIFPSLCQRFIEKDKIVYLLRLG